MKISTGGIGTVASAMSSSKAHHAVVAEEESYPDDWAWSMTYGHSSVLTSTRSHGFNETTHWRSSAGVNEPVLNPENDGIRYTRYVNPAMGDTSYGFGFDVTGISADAMSSDNARLLDGDTTANPNGTTLDLATSKYLTVYLKLITIDGSNVVTDPGGGAVYWSNQPSAIWNNYAFSTSSTIRRSLNSFGDTAITTSGDYNATGSEYISISFDMTTSPPDPVGTQTALNGAWDLAGVQIDDLLGIPYTATGVGDVIDVYGVVVSNKNNTDAAIYDVTLPIKTS